MSSVRQALEFVCKTISDAETVREVSRHGSRAEALASKSHEMHSRCFEALDGEPKPVTKKLSEIIAENPKLQVNGIRRRDAHCEPIWNTVRHQSLELTWCVDAWSVRPAKGVYQQIIIFVPEIDTE